MRRVLEERALESAEKGGRINYRVADRDLKYYIFDWDDNILHMPTRVHMERRADDGQWAPVAVTTAVFSIIRKDSEHYRPPGGDWARAFVEFHDDTADGVSRFLEDTKEALAPAVAGEMVIPPSFNRFRKTLIEGRLFAIVTARGHSPKAIRTVVEYFVANVLTRDEREEMLRNLRGYIHHYEKRAEGLSDADVLDYYLGLNRYHPVTSREFQHIMGDDSAQENQEKAKQLAVRDFVDHVVSILREVGANRPISIGFSDDDPRNVEAVERYIRKELSREFPNVNFAVYDTSDPDVPAGRKVLVSGQLKLGL